MVRLATRIGRGFLLSCGALGVVLVAMLAAFHVSRSANAAVHENYLASVNTAGALLNLVEHMDNLEFAYLATGGERQAREREFAETAAEFDRAYADAHRLAVTPAETAHYVEIGRQYGAFRLIHDRMQALAARGKWTEARALDAGESLQAHIALRAAALAFLQTNLAAAHDARRQEERTLAAAEAFAVLIALAGALGAGLVWRGVTRDVVLPLRQLRDATRSLAAGRGYPQEAPVPTRTEEIGELQADFQRMAVELGQAEARLRAANGQLEAEVAGRTAQLVEANDRLTANLAELQALDRLKSQFVAITSHELLTPIAFIVGFASSLEDGVMGPLAPAQAEAVGKILAGAERLTRMVRNTLEYSYLEAGQLAVHPEAADLAEIARNVAEPLAERAAETGVALDLAFPAEAVPAWTDPDRTGQLLGELLDNALKFTPQGGRVRLAVRATPEGALCEVADTGPGVPPDALDRLAQPFYQLDSTMTRRHGGLGLGLALAYGLARLLKGRLEVRSAVGQGTTFRLTLPPAPRS